MIDTRKLIEIIAEKNYDFSKVASKLDITKEEFVRKLGDGIMMSDEIQTLAEFLEIEKPWEVFFAPPLKPLNKMKHTRA